MSGKGSLNALFAGRLRISNLARETGFRITPIREALAMLESFGLAEAVITYAMADDIVETAGIGSAQGSRSPASLAELAAHWSFSYAHGVGVQANPCGKGFGRRRPGGVPGLWPEDLKGMEGCA
jgi:hypothetical protein